jgi:hypothetical protein
MKRLLALIPLLCLTLAATYGPPFSVSDISSLTNRPNPSIDKNPAAFVTGGTNTDDGTGGLFIFDAFNTNVVDGITYFPSTTSGRWVRLTYGNLVAASPLAINTNAISLAALTNWFTFIAGTNMEVTTTANSVTFAMTNTTFSGSGGTTSYTAAASSPPIYTPYFQATTDITYNVSGTNIQAYMVQEALQDAIGASLFAGANISISYDDGTGLTTISGISSSATNGTSVSVDSGSALVAANFTDTTEIDFTGSGTNVTADLKNASVGIARLSTTGTPTSTNFLAGDYAFKQVTTNMIPGLNAVLATIGTGGGGSGAGTNAFINGQLVQPLYLTNSATVTIVTNSGSIAFNATPTGTNSTVVYVDGAAVTDPNFQDNSTGIQFTATSTNIQGAIVDRDFGDITTTSSGASWTIDNSAITSNKLAAANVTQDKLSATGTPTSTNFLAGDYVYKQVTTNMIPGLNAVLATIGTGGSGGGAGTNIFVNGALVSQANLQDSSNVLWSVSGTNITATITNVVGSTADNVLQWIGSAYFVITNNSTIGDFSQLVTNGVVSTTILEGTGENDAPVVVEIGFPSRSTNYLWTVMFEGDVNGAVAYEMEGTRTATSVKIKMHEAAGSTFFTGGYWTRVDLFDKATVGGSGSGLTEIQASALYQATNANLTTVANLTSGTSTNFYAGDGSFKQVTTNMVPGLNAVLATIGSGGSADGSTNASMTITNLTVGSVNSKLFYNPANGDIWSDGLAAGGAIATAFTPYYGYAINSGTAANDTTGVDVNDPYRALISSSSSSDSGYKFQTSANSYWLAGGELSESGVYITKTNNIVIRWGFLDSLSATEPVDGVYFELENGNLYGKTASNNSRTSTSSVYVPVEDSTIIVRGLVELNSDATLATFTIYTNSVQAWQDTVAANIPTGSGRVTGSGAFGIHTGTGAGTNICYLGWIGTGNTRTLQR